MKTTYDTQIEKLANEIDEIGLDVATGYTLADAMREGSRVTEQEIGGWGAGDTACALNSAFVAAKARKFV